MMKTNKTTISYHHCDKCERVFGSAPALRMHVIRKHSGQNWDTSRNFKKTPDKRHNKAGKLYPSETPAYKRAYYAKRKAALATKGLNVHGKPFRNGAAPVVAPTQSDPLSDAAKAILVAAKVLRGTMHSLKLPLVFLLASLFFGCGEKEQAPTKMTQDQINCYNRWVDLGSSSDSAFDWCVALPNHLPLTSKRAKP